jgi:hypothetical protein
MKKPPKPSIKIGRQKRFAGEISNVRVRGISKIEGVELRVFRTLRSEAMLGFYTIEPRHQDKKHPERVVYSYHVITFTAEKDGRLNIEVSR